MTPLFNLDEIKNYDCHEHNAFKSKRAGVSEHIGAKKLSYSIAVVPPGHKVCPFHNHRINEEMFLILEGEGTLRYGEKQYPIRKNHIIACPPGGREHAHQIMNTGVTDIRYLCLSTNEPNEICEYPDSNKMLAMVGGSSETAFRHIANMEDDVDYFLGEN